MWQGYDTDSWQETEGVIYQSRMLEETRRGADVLYTHELIYRYQLPDGSYTGNQVYRTDMPLYSEVYIQELVNQFPVGSVQKVFVNPTDYNEAVLIRGISVQLLLALIFALACFGVGMISFRADTKARDRR